MPALHSEPVSLGWTAPDFALPATDGRSYQLGDLRGVRGLVVGFICNHCPFVVAIADRLAADCAALQAQGFGVAMICSNDAVAYPADSFPNMKIFSERYGFSFPYLHDADQSVARAYDAICTPDLYGFDAMLRAQYRGRLDSAGRAAAGPDTKRELFDAMTQMAHSGKAPQTQHPSIGCSIKWAE